MNVIQFARDALTGVRRIMALAAKPRCNHRWVPVAVWNKRPDHNDNKGESWDGAFMTLCRDCARPRHYPAQYRDTYNGQPAHLFSLVLPECQEPFGDWVTLDQVPAQFRKWETRHA